MSEPIQPRGMKVPNLSHALGKKRPSTSAATTTPSPRAAEEAEHPATPSRTEPPAVVATSKPRDPKPAAPAHARSPHTVFYLPPDLCDLLRKTAHAQHKTNADVMLDALEATVEELQDLINADRAEPETGGVFTRTRPRPVGQKVQITGRIQPGNLKVIDRLAAKCGADSRSHLVDVALRAYLTTTQTAAQAG